MIPLLEALESRVLIGDGAYGTLLSGRGLLTAGGIGPLLNITKPAFVQAAHREYIDAGADCIETNTFGADKLALAAADSTASSYDVCKAGAEVARKAASDKAYVLGSIGPLFRTSAKLTDTERKECFIAEVKGLLDGGVDAILLETFSDIDELKLAIASVRVVSADIPLIAQMAFSLAGTTTTGATPIKQVEVLNELDVDVIGVNCGGGETASIDTIRKITERTEKLVSVYPNRGLADFDELGRPMYIESSDYFASSARRLADLGANLIGGCCGTSPDDIRKLKSQVNARRPSMRQMVVASEVAVAPKVISPITLQPTLEEDIKTRRVVIAEIDPPRSVDASKELRGTRKIHEAGADAITIADNPLSIMRMSNLAMASLLMKELDARILLHVACRDRSLIGTQSHLLGAYAMGITNILAVTGDPVSTQAHKGSTGVFDMASHKLIELISRFNNGDFGDGRVTTSFFTGGAFNCGSRKLENEVVRFERKIAAGARFVMTQPVFDIERARRVAELTRPLGVPLVLGIMPLVSERNAEFLHHEVPGIDVPESVRKRMTGLKGPDGRAMGLEIAKELMLAISPEVQGFYLITPMGRYSMIAQLTEYAHSLAEVS
ncbi:MAG: bifunctional homocysteine S-methyltransferase/methylenetetrahydrofolate reductase [Planctomycetota bacterium]|jgi:homocysteine S-methyltransferase